MSQARNQSTVPLDLLSAGIVALTSAAALIHLVMGLTLGPPRLTAFPLALLLYLNAFGYFVLLVAFCLPPLARMRHLVRWALIAYASVTFVLWFVLSPSRGPFGIMSVVFEGTLIALLILDERRATLQAKKARGGAEHT